jgi:anti-sigma regulatory factor (Ser/Thr protein kinase)
VTAAPSISVTLSNQLAEIERLAHLVDAFCAEQHLSAALAYHINLALDEVITNVIMHGYDDAQGHEILARVSVDGPTIVIEVTDDGRPFNPLDAPPVDFTTDPLDRPVGGLGLHLVRTLMDAIEYRYEQGRNHLVMRKDSRRES